MISVITPTHDPKYLLDAYESLMEQTYQNWEWILVPNNGANIPFKILSNDKVKVIPFESSIVGELKRFGFTQAKGDWLVELDHDDKLMPTCLEEIAKHADEGYDFLWSNCVEVDEDAGGTWSPRLYSSAYGWQYRPYYLSENQMLLETLAADGSYPSNWSRIWFAPNHVRAWKKEFYISIGGHNPSMVICDDADLLCRTYIRGKVGHIDKPLYIQRIHGNNSWLKYNEEIQQTLWSVHNAYFMEMAETWVKAEGGRIIDLGGAIDCPEGYESYDRHNADIVGNLNEKWELEDDSVGILRAWDTLEHLKDPIQVMNEAYRVLKHGGIFDIWVPSTRGEGAFCDPTHTSFWNQRSFKYYTDPDTRKYIEPECTAKFQLVQLQDVDRWDEGIPYVHAQLLAVKDMEARIHGVMLWK